MDQPNRHQRRALKHALSRTDFATPLNGVAHASLTTQAYEALCQHLHDTGNTLSTEHRDALFALCGLFTESAQGKRPGRWAFSLPTGMGKTSAVVEWCATLSRLGLDHIAVAVSASKVAALVQIKKDLIARGVREECVGLLYTPNGERHDLPPTDENADRQVMLVAHNRVRMKAGHQRFNTYRGKARDLMIWDEGLVASDAYGVGVRRLRNAVAWLASDWSDDAAYAPHLAWLTRATELIEAAVSAATPKEPATLLLPSLEDTAYEALRSALPSEAAVVPIVDFMGFCREELRVLPTSERGVAYYQMAVPRDIQNIIVLDASYPIRRLVQADASIKDAEKHLDPIKRIGKPLSQLKRYDSVVLHQLFSGGGRKTMQRDFANRDQRHAVSEVVEVVKSIPAAEDVLIFTFKDRAQGGRRDDYKGALVRGLLAAGIDPHAKATPGKGKPDNALRINIATWGQETSLNCWARCSNVILCGVLQRSSLDLASSYIGQSDNLLQEVSTATLKALERSEVAHVVYQALSRGRCRVMENGQALAMKGWIIHRDVGIQPLLSGVMPGVRWEEWKAQHLTTTEGRRPGVTASTVVKIAEHLKGLPVGVSKVSTRRLKEDAGLKAVHPATFTAALRAAQDHAPWRMEGRSVVRASLTG